MKCAIVRIVVAWLGSRKVQQTRWTPTLTRDISLVDANVHMNTFGSGVCIHDHHGQGI